MGFAKDENRRAQADQEAALARERAVLDEQQKQVKAYQDSYNTRNAGMIVLQNHAKDWLDQYNKGVDINTLNPAFAKAGQDAAHQVMQTMGFASKMGDASQQNGDAGYQQQLSSLSARQIAKGLAAQQEEGLLSEKDNQTNILASSTGFLNQDSQAGIGLQGNLGDASSVLFQNATMKRKMAMERAQNMMNNLFSGISAGVGAFSMAFGAGGFAKGFGKGGGGGGGTPPFVPASSNGFSSFTNFSPLARQNGGRQ